ENTLLSFKKALDLQVDAIELDVHLCKTKEVVVIHDNKVDRTTNGTGYVAEKTFSELRLLDAGKGQKIPALQEVFDLIKRKITINIELKGKGTAKPVSEIIEKYVRGKGWQYDDFLVSSFNRHELLEFSKLKPEIKIGLVTVKASLDLAVKIKAHSVNVRYDAVNEDFVSTAHKKRLMVFAWTVNNSKDIKRIKSYGVDGIFSDFPDRL
ncbi:MAG: glycerophosphodiester phosphodiesterase family protein, partial [Nitrospirota bacterium]